MGEGREKYGPSGGPERWVRVRGVGFFFFQAEDGIRDLTVTGVQTCALPIYLWRSCENRALGAILERAAAVNNQSLAGDEFRTREKHYGVGDVARCAGAAQRRELDKGGLPVRRIPGHGDGARRDSVHPHFRRQRLGEHLR